MSVVVEPVTTSRQLRDFARFPFHLYKGEKNWVPPLGSEETDLMDPKKNPTARHCDYRAFLARRNGEVVGRIVAVVNPLINEARGVSQVRFFMPDFVDDPEVTDALFGAVETFGRERGLAECVGPIGFQHLDKQGMLIEGFDELTTMAAYYNYPYYRDHMVRMGYGKDVDWLEFRVTAPTEIPEKFTRLTEIMKKRTGIRLLEARSKKDFLPYVHKLFDVLNEAYREIYGAADLDPAEIDHAREEYFGFIDTDFTKLALNEDGEAVGFGITMPSLSRALQKAKGRLFPFGFIHLLRALKKPEVLDFYLIGVLPEYQSRGVPLIIMTSIMEGAIRRGIRFAETNLELEDNKDVQGLWKMFETRQHKRRRAWKKAL